MKLKINKSFIVIIILSVCLLFLIINQRNLYKQINDKEQSITVVSNNSISTEKKIEEVSTNPKYKIKVYYPFTGYEKLNKAIKSKIDNNVNTFKEEALDHVAQKNQYYTLDITYDTYTYNEYISYVFHISTYLGGAHPGTIIWSVTYNKDTNQIIDINSLKKDNENILNIISKESENSLMNDKRLDAKNNKVVEEMVLEGTRPTRDNFKNFAFSGEGLIVFFEQYQVAPYSYGEFHIVIPYNKLNIT